LDYNEIKISILHSDKEKLADILLEYSSLGLYIEDYSDVDALCEQGIGDYIDDELIEKDKDRVVIHVYFEANEAGDQTIEDLKTRISAEKLEAALVESMLVNEESWVNGWKEFYQIMHIGENLVVKPSWKEYTPASDEKVIILDPATAFGTGMHETTQMCMTHIEKTVVGGERVLELGVGSGILSIAAVLLGVESVHGVDISEDAVRIAGENAEKNGVGQSIHTAIGNLYAEIDGKYGIIIANIVADVILKIIPDTFKYLTSNGVAIFSGIIDDRVEEIEHALQVNKYQILEKQQKGEWFSFVVRWEENDEGSNNSI